VVSNATPMYAAAPCAVETAVRSLIAPMGAVQGTAVPFAAQLKARTDANPGSPPRVAPV
jgi:hypothetical protein